MSANATILRKLLWAVPVGTKPVADCPELYRTTASQAAAYVRTGKVLLVSRERVESILEELEGKEARAVDYDQIFGAEEYPHADEPALDDADEFRDPRKPMAPRDYHRRGRGRGGQKLEQQRQRIIDYMRERPADTTKSGICKALGINASNAAYLFSDPRFICPGRRQPVTLDEQAIETHKLMGKTACSEDSLKYATQMVFAELQQFGPQTLEQLVAVLKFDRPLVVAALASEKFEQHGDRWRVKRQPPNQKLGFTPSC